MHAPRRVSVDFPGLLSPARGRRHRPTVAIGGAPHVVVIFVHAIAHEGFVVVLAVDPGSLGSWSFCLYHVKKRRVGMGGRQRTIFAVLARKILNTVTRNMIHNSYCTIQKSHVCCNFRWMCTRCTGQQSPYSVLRYRTLRPRHTKRRSAQCCRTGAQAFLHRSNAEKQAEYA